MFAHTKALKLNVSQLLTFCVTIHFLWVTTFKITATIPIYFSFDLLYQIVSGPNICLFGAVAFYLLNSIFAHPPDKSGVTQSGLWVSLLRHAFSVQPVHFQWDLGQSFIKPTSVLQLKPFCFKVCLRSLLC